MIYKYKGREKEYKKEWNKQYWEKNKEKLKAKNKYRTDEDRAKARETLGIEKDALDMEAINKKYKEMARQAHPDMEGGCVEKFKEINNAHKILKRELM